MTTFVSRIARNASRGAALLGLAALFAAAPASLAQERKLVDPKDAAQPVATNHATASGELRAVMFPAGDPMKVQVIFENLALERMVLTIRNENGKVIHSKVVGRHKTYTGRLDLSALPDGEYTLQLKGESSRYSRPFRIQTETARLALVE